MQVDMDMCTEKSHQWTDSEGPPILTNKDTENKSSDTYIFGYIINVCINLVAEFYSTGVFRLYATVSCSFSAFIYAFNNTTLVTKRET